MSNHSISNYIDPANWRRTGKVHIRVGHLLQLLDFPDGTDVRVVMPSYDPVGLDILVEHEDLHVVQPDSESPYVGLVKEYAAGQLVASRWQPDGHGYTTITDEPLTTTRLADLERTFRSLTDAIRSALEDLPEKPHDAEATLRRALGEEN